MDRPACFRFGDFVLDIRRHRLFRRGEEVVLPTRAVTVLETLVAAAPETVTKVQLMEAAWADVAVVDDNLVQAIGAIRTALGDDPKEPTFVQTVHRRGYRFIAPVEPVVEAVPTQRIRLADIPLPQPGSISRRVVLVAVAVAVAVTAVGLGFGLWPAAAPVRSLAVLPMTDLTPQADDPYFAAGMTDALITELARYAELDVISRTSMEQYRGTRKTVPKIADELGVDALVEGTVTRADGRVRVIAQLVDERDRHLWGESFERPLEDVLILQRQVAEAVAAEIGATLQLRPALETGRPTIEPAAHRAYLRGRRVSEQRTEESLVRAVELFEEAVSIEPEWAEPWLGLADIFNLLANYGYRPSDAARPRARHAARRALELDPDLAEAHTALALVAAEYDWDFAAADVAFRRALELNPSSSTSHSWYAHFLASQGDLDEAVLELQRAHRLDPLSSIVEANIGWFRLFAGEVELAEQRLRETLDFDPDFVVAHYYLGILLATQGRAEEGAAHLERAVELSGGADFARAALACSLAAGGDLRGARRIRQELVEESAGRYVSPVSLTYAAVAVGDVDGAFAALEDAYRERKGWLLHLRLDPLIAGLRADPRFEDLAARVGLPS